MTREPIIPGRPLSQGSVLTVEQAVRSLSPAYVRAEAELRRTLAAYVEAAALDPTSTARFRAERERALLSRIGELRTDLDRQAGLFADDTMGRVYNGGVSRTDRALAAAGFGTPQGQATFAAVHRQALEVMASDAFDDLAAATGYMEANAKRVIREAAKLRTTVGAATGATVGDDTRRLVRELHRGGVTGFVDAAGRSWRLSTYAEMVVRTKSAQAYNTGTVLRGVETGTMAYEISDGQRSEHAACIAYNRTTCSAGWALDHPIEHPNCVRSFSPLPLHTGPVDHGEIDEEVSVAPDPEGRDDLDDLLEHPDRWLSGATQRKDGRWMPGEQALAANRAIIARGAKADEAIDRALTARGIPKAGPAELNAAQTAVADASREWGTVRGRWLAEQTRGGADLDDLLRLLQAGSSNLDNIPAALAWIPDEVWTARRAVDTAQDALSAVYANRRAYATAWQEEARRYLYASRGEGRAFTVGTVDDAGRAIWDRAAASYPAPWADRWDATVGTAQVRWGTGRGWNRTNRTSSGRVSVEIQTGTARGDGLATTIHEIGHTFETTVPGLSSAEWTFLRYRATGPRGGLDQPRVIPGYRRTETYYRDAKMPAPYTAKVYGELPSSHFELFTTGAEGVLGPVSSYLDFIAEDLEFRRWILGMLDNL